MSLKHLELQISDSISTLHDLSSKISLINEHLTFTLFQLILDPTNPHRLTTNLRTYSDQLYTLNTTRISLLYKIAHLKHELGHLKFTHPDTPINKFMPSNNINKLFKAPSQKYLKHLFNTNMLNYIK